MSVSRLTIKDNRTKSGCRLPTYATKNEEDVFIKLFELENLEEELGIDLITLFKAIETKIYAEAYHYKTGKPSILDFEEPRLIKYEEWCLAGTCGTFTYCVALKDYGKTWSLSRYELEEQ